MIMVVAAVCLGAQAPDSRVRAPRFEDYPAREVWQGKPPSLKLVTHSERMFRTRLTEAANQAPNFAGHYRITYWGCGSNCSAGAMIDLRTGDVYQLPLATPNGSGWERWIECTACFDETGEDVHVDSSLMVSRCGLNYSERLHKNVPDTYYFLWEGATFRRLLFIPGKSAGK